jgi:EamA-like transporter family
VTGLQLMAAAVAVLPVALISEHHAAGPMSMLALLATIGLVLAGTVLPTSLFAFGQSRVTADVAGAFLNLEPLVGAVMGIVLFAEPAGPVQLAGGAAIITGIGLSSFQVVRAERRRRVGATATNLAAANLAATSPAPAGVAAGSRLAAGEAPSMVRRTRYPRPRHDDVARVRPTALGPAGRGALASGRERPGRQQPGSQQPERKRPGHNRPGRKRTRPGSLQESGRSWSGMAPTTGSTRAPSRSASASLTRGDTWPLWPLRPARVHHP